MWIFKTTSGYNFKSEFNDYKAACEEFVEFLSIQGYIDIIHNKENNKTK